MEKWVLIGIVIALFLPVIISLITTWFEKSPLDKALELYAEELDDNIKW